MFEGFLADNYLFLNSTECLEWIDTVMKKFTKEDEFIDDWICKKSIYDVADRLRDHIIDLDEEYDYDMLLDYLSHYSSEQLGVLYYKNNMVEFIRDHEEIQSIIIDIYENTGSENLERVDTKDNDWFGKIPEEYKNQFSGKSAKDWNKYVNKTYFMDPNDPPEELMADLCSLSNYLIKYVYSRYLSVDRIYRLQNFKRKVVTVIDTDSNILCLDTLINFIYDEVTHHLDYGRDKESNDFISVNMMAFVITNAVSDILLYYGEQSNIPEEYRPIFNMKNEFYFSRLLIGKTKKRYISKILLREGNLMKPAKKDIKGFDFKKATCSEFAEKFYMKLISKYIIEEEGDIKLKDMVIELNNFKNMIKESIQKGETTYLTNVNAKEFAAYKNPSSQQSVAAVLAWDTVYPDKQIELPSKVSLLKLNIFTEDDIKDMKDKYPDIYKKIIDGIFHDDRGIFVIKSWDNGIRMVNPKKKDWWKDIPKKYQARYKKLSAEQWNEFVELYDGDPSGEVLEKCKGLQAIAIPSNESIPEWCMDYIDYNTLIDNILAPFTPVLEIFKFKQLSSGKTHNGVDRSTTGFSNIVKF